MNSPALPRSSRSQVTRCSAPPPLPACAAALKATVGSVFALLCLATSAAAVPTLYTVGDSTVQSYSTTYYPRAGWGQVLRHFFDPNKLSVVNKAVGGTSSKTFYEKGHWTNLKGLLQPGDYVTVQFGINDSANDTRHTDPATTFKDFLRRYVNETRALGAYPILVTTQNRNAWTSDSPPRVIPVYGAYAAATREVAAELDVPLVDLDQGSRALMESLGKTYSTYFLFHHYPPGEWVNFPNGAADDVHFQEAGATELAKLVVAGFRSLSSDPHVSQLIPFLKPTYKVTFNSNNPAAGLVSRTEDFPAGIKVTAYARPNPGYTFANWSGAISGTKHVTFTMGTAAKTITANFAVDGNPSTSATLQAENAAYGDGVSRRTDASGFNGTAFVNFPVTGGFLQFANIDGGSGGQATLSVRHALASGTRTGVLIVNGTSQPITFGSTGGWSTWRTHTVSIALNSGSANTIRFEASGQDLTNIDEITITTSTSLPPPAGAQTYPAETAAIAGGVTIVSNYAGYRGTGLAAFPVNGGTLTFTQVAGNGGGAKSLAVRYANGGPSARTGALTVNGQTSPITFPRTGSWTTWATLNVPITLRADATNTVQLASTGSDLANIDEITIP